MSCPLALSCENYYKNDHFFKEEPIGERVASGLCRILRAVLTLVILRLLVLERRGFEVVVGGIVGRS